MAGGAKVERRLARADPMVGGARLLAGSLHSQQAAASRCLAGDQAASSPVSIEAAKGVALLGIGDGGGDGPQVNTGPSHSSGPPSRRQRRPSESACDEQVELQVAAKSSRSSSPCLTSSSTTLPATVHLQSP
ncbi:unnamed protein product [Urochloa humidicola]